MEAQINALLSWLPGLDVVGTHPWLLVALDIGLFYF